MNEIMNRCVPLSDDALQQAAAHLAAGELVAVPTETVYGLAADATNPEAVARIYEAKGRPSANPLIAHMADRAMAENYAAFPTLAARLADAFWPGPLTLVLEGGAALAPAVTAGLPTIAMRHPVGPMAQLAAKLGKPLAAPSANLSGKLSPTRAEHVLDGLEDRVAMILEGEPCKAGLESTIVKVVGERAILLRPGPLGLSDLKDFNIEPAQSGQKVESPGTHFRHYAPSVPLRMNAKEVHPNEALIAFAAPISHQGPVFQLSAEGNLKEAAHNLFNALWQAERSGVSAIAVQPIPSTGIGMAINERLKRAAQGSQTS